MIGYVLSLSLMLVLANVPIDDNFLGGGDAAFSANANYPDEPLPIITVQDLPEKEEVTEERAATKMRKREQVAQVDQGEANERGLELRRAPALRPTAMAATSLPTVEETRKLLRFTGGPPSVDEPPEMRVGSMFVRYPLSALKKAIQGLVIVRFIVEPSGRASGVEIVKGLDPACDAEVVEAVERARFLPGKRKGREVPAYSQMTVRFVLAANSQPATTF